jgi:hypothetical protein
MENNMFLSVKPHHPLAEILARKLFSIETVPAKEQRRMVQRAIKAAVEYVLPIEEKARKYNELYK